MKILIEWIAMALMLTGAAHADIAVSPFERVELPADWIVWFLVIIVVAVTAAILNHMRKK